MCTLKKVMERKILAFSNDRSDVAEPLSRDTTSTGPPATAKDSLTEVKSGANPIKHLKPKGGVKKINSKQSFEPKGSISRALM